MPKLSGEASQSQDEYKKGLYCPATAFNQLVALLAGRIAWAQFLQGNTFQGHHLPSLSHQHRPLAITGADAIFSVLGTSCRRQREALQSLAGVRAIPIAQSQ
jgi:hypothetical protein